MDTSNAIFSTVPSGTFIDFQKPKEIKFRLVGGPHDGQTVKMPEHTGSAMVSRPCQIPYGVKREGYANYGRRHGDPIGILRFYGIHER